MTDASTSYQGVCGKDDGCPLCVLHSNAPLSNVEVLKLNRTKRIVVTLNGVQEMHMDIDKTQQQITWEMIMNTRKHVKQVEERVNLLFETMNEVSRNLKTLVDRIEFMPYEGAEGFEKAKEDFESSMNNVK